MPDTRAFPLADVLSVTTGRLLSARSFDGLLDVLRWMTGQDLALWQTPRAADVCTEALIRQHPWIAELKPEPTLAGVELFVWLALVETDNPDPVDVECLSEGEWKHRAPAAELWDLLQIAALNQTSEPERNTEQ